jgi:hypothetical protein
MCHEALFRLDRSSTVAEVLLDLLVTPTAVPGEESQNPALHTFFPGAPVPASDFLEMRVATPSTHWPRNCAAIDVDKT